MSKTLVFDVRLKNRILVGCAENRRRKQVLSVIEYAGLSDDYVLAHPATGFKVARFQTEESGKKADDYPRDADADDICRPRRSNRIVDDLEAIRNAAVR